LHDRGYGLTDPEALVVISEARRRAATEIKYLVAYLNRMAENGELLDIVEAVQLAAEKIGEPEQPDQPAYQPPTYTPPVAESRPVSEIPSADPLAGLTREQVMDWAHVSGGCKILRCERCLYVRESGEHPMFPAATDQNEERASA